LSEGRAPFAALPFDDMLNYIPIGVGVGIAEKCLALPLVVLID
jgi:hypothetical protein